MKTRILTAAVGIPVTAAIMWASLYCPYVLCGTLLMLALIGVHEALKTAGADKVRVLYVPCFAYGIAVMLAPFLGDALKMYGGVLAASMIYLFVMFAILLRKHSVLRIETLFTSMILTMFVAIPFMVAELIFLTMMKNVDGTPSYGGGIALVSYCLLVAWIADGAAYFTGRAFGRHKLAPVLSPKKTIEGSVGGFVFSMILSIAAAFLYADVLGCTSNGIHYTNLIIITAVCILMSMFGDISFSTVKRQYGIKDFGNLLPGHGGVLDRFDSVLFVCPTFYLLNFVLPVLK